MPEVASRWWLVGAAFAITTAACAEGGIEADRTTTTSVPPTTTAVPETAAPSPVETTQPAVPEPRHGAALPTARTEVAGAVWDGRIVVVGGLTSAGGVSRRADAYDPASDEWEALPDLPEALHHTALGVLGDRLYVVGGYAIEGDTWVARAEVWSLGPGEQAWREEPAMRARRGALSVASTGSHLVAIGGVGSLDSLTSTEVLEAGAGAWVEGPAMAERREHLAATAVGDEVYAIAGRAGFMDTNTTSVEVLRDGEWHQAPPLNHSRSGIGAAIVDGVPCVAGGEEPAGTIGAVECLLGGEWRVVANLEVPRHGLAVVAVAGRLHVIGGGPSPGLTVSDVHEIVPIVAP
jgi:hypothetical protein